MRLGARLTGAEFTLLTRFGPARWTTYRQDLFLRDFHSVHIVMFPGDKMFNFDQQEIAPSSHLLALDS